MVTTTQVLTQLRLKADTLRRDGWVVEVECGERQVLLTARKHLARRVIHVKQLQGCFVWRSYHKGRIRVQTLY
jgi:hypothetical protein